MSRRRTREQRERYEEYLRNKIYPGLTWRCGMPGCDYTYTNWSEHADEVECFMMEHYTVCHEL